MDKNIKKNPPNFKTVYCCNNCWGKLEESGKWKIASTTDECNSDECCFCGKSPTRKIILVDRF